MHSKILKSIISVMCLFNLTVNAQIKKPAIDCNGEDDCCKKDQPKTNIQVSKIKGNKVVACKLTSPELQKRKSEVISLLKAKVLGKKELTNGYQYSFEGSDEMIEDILSFIKTERSCCSFFTFTLLIEDADTNVVVSITGPKGAKEFIDAEMNL